MGSESLIDCYSSPTHIPLISHCLSSFTLIILSPFPLALCTSVSWVSFLALKRFVPLIPGLWLPLSVMVPPSASSVLTAQLLNPPQSEAAFPTPVQVKCLSCIPMIARLSFWLLSISLCSWAVGGSILRARTVHFCVSVFAVPRTW